MVTPEFVALRALMGDAWVEANILSEKSEHLLGRWYRKADGNPWVQYTDQLVERLMGSDRLAFDKAALARKLAAEYVSTLAEIEVAVHLLEQGFGLVLEPTAPAKGPDFRADIADKSYFVEVRAVSDSEDDERFNAVSSEVFARLSATPSRYTVEVTVGDDCIAGSGELKKAIDQIVNALSVMKEKKWGHARLFHSSSGSILDPGTGLSAEEKDMVAKAEIIAHFNDTGKDEEQTVASAWRPYKSPPEPDQTHERLKKMLSKKRTQLPENSRGILVFDVSELFMLSDFSIESALYGDLVVRLTAASTPGGPIGEPTLFRNGRGFFGKSSRVSAVVFHTRFVDRGKMENRWRVYPTNRANEGTIQLEEAELSLFGDLEDRKNLSAENLPEALSPASEDTTEN
ncbi:MAG: hypothetical protein BGO25_19830 [Acidobacteriales bacterium 59-55]|nr:MAG: hypothetical protein BGO25_19830 [Acidobacteriales bacterium 59-55]